MSKNYFYKEVKAVSIFPSSEDFYDGVEGVGRMYFYKDGTLVRRIWWKTPEKTVHSPFLAERLSGETTYIVKNPGAIYLDAIDKLHMGEKLFYRIDEDGNIRHAKRPRSKVGKLVKGIQMWNILAADSYQFPLPVTRWTLEIQEEKLIPVKIESFSRGIIEDSAMHFIQNRHVATKYLNAALTRGMKAVFSPAKQTEGLFQRRIRVPYIHGVRFIQQLPKHMLAMNPPVRQLTV